VASEPPSQGVWEGALGKVCPGEKRKGVGEKNKKRVIRLGQAKTNHTGLLGNQCARLPK